MPSLCGGQTQTIRSLNLKTVMPEILVSKLELNKEMLGDGNDSALAITTDKPLAKGQYVFRLLVLDDAEPANRSDPTEHTVIVLDDQKPTAIISRDNIVSKSSRVGFNQPFKLSGEKSTDAGGGKIVRYLWTLVERPPQ